MRKKQFSLNKEFIIKWNNKYPFDYIWRRKYNIPFGSDKHLSMTLFDMIVDLEEQRMYTQLINKKEDTFVEKSDRLLIPRRTKYVKMNQKEIDLEFEKLDIDNLDFGDKKIKI